MLSVLVKQYTSQLFHAFFSTLSIASVSHTMSVHSTMFPVYQPFELERVMPVSSGVKTQSSNKTVLPLGGDSTPVVHAQEPALPHITQTLTDCTPTTMDREPASPNLTPTPADSYPVAVDTTPSPPQSSQTRAVSKAVPVHKAQYYHGEPQLHQLVCLFLWRKHNQLVVV